MSEQISKSRVANAIELPLLALRGLTMFPNMIIHFDVGREKSIKALEEAMSGSRHIFLVAQRDVQTDNPAPSDLYEMGTIGVVKQILKVPGDNAVRVMVEGLNRAKLVSIVSEKPFFISKVEPVPPTKAAPNTPRTEALVRYSYSLFEK